MSEQPNVLSSGDGSPQRRLSNNRLTNKEVAELLEQVASILQILDANRFRVIAFQNAAEAIKNFPQDIHALHADGKLESIPGIGKGIAGALNELFTHGTVKEFDELKAQVPVGVVEMMQVPDMGPKKARRLWEELAITSVAELKSAAEAGQLRKLKGFGAKSEEKILKGIELLAKRGDDRTPIGDARPLALRLVAGLQAALPKDTIERIEVGGSLRRWKETIGDLDLLCVSRDPATTMKAFQSLPQVHDVTHAGDTKSSVILTTGMQVDLRVVERKHWGAALQYFTGSKEHNVPMRELALRQGWSLNEYCLTATGKGDAAEGEECFFEEEAELYEFLGLAWVPPELRENRGEIQAARAHKLPKLIALEDICGELHGHSTWSDGTASIAEMAEVARARGYQYWALCDHSVGLGMVGGLDGERLQEQAKEIARLNQEYAEQGIDFRLLRGTEVEILADGSLGLPDDVLAALDVVVASIHSGLRQDRETITERCLKAIRNPHVDILGHATGRLIGSRAPSEIDMERVLQGCLETGTVPEINAHPSRLDINDVYARRAVELGCKIAINSDAHAVDGMEIMAYGVATARRAWLTADDVINTRTLAELWPLLKDQR
ncbi:MAG: DNA polymerase/3'-5' exonuclease PolX [Caldilineaceae bacterium]|nr:DNA polymerase/3'-5' exonuclease PolX [Caldilineaceae bacterium]